MISINLKNAFNNLDIEDKRNKISDELLFIGELIKKIQQFNGLEYDFQIKNYDSNMNINEQDMLNFLYEDIFEIQRQLLLIIANYQINK